MPDQYFEYIPGSPDKKYEILDHIKIEYFKYFCFVRQMEIENGYYIRSKQDLLDFVVDCLTNITYLKFFGIYSLTDHSMIFSSEGMFFDTLNRMSAMYSSLMKVSVENRSVEFADELFKIKTQLLAIKHRLQTWLIDHLKKSEFLQ